MSQNEALHLLDKYLRGECSEEEKQYVLSWLEGMGNNSNEWSVLSGEAKRKYIEKLYADLQTKMGPDANRKKNKGRRFGYQVAAALLVLIAAGGFLYFIISQPKDTVTVKYVRTSTGIGEMQRIMLKDGTQVWLNALSELRYPSHFDGNKREVYLKGEAFFEVAKRAAQPFVVHSGVLHTKVLGTSFDIHAYPEDKRIDITVLSGKVAVNKGKPESNTIILKKNEKVHYTKEAARMVKQTVTKSDAAFAWRQKQLAFYHTPMTEVAKAFYRTFGIKLRFADKTVQKYEISGHFEIKQKPENILKAICLSIGGEYSRQEGAFVIEGPESGK